LNRGIGAQLPAPILGPFNKIVAGPVYSLHHPDGSLATDSDWFEPQYIGPNLTRKLQQEWDRVRKNEEGIRQILRRSPYAAVLEDALRRYCRALDLVELSSSFLNLWSLLETLTGISPRDRHDKVVKRASFIYADPERKMHELVLHHLRRYRNSYVHVGEGSDRAGAYLYQLRRYVEDMLTFHLQNSRTASSLDRLVQFLDLPADVGEIQREIADQERIAETAREAARLAQKGLRFRRGELT
jgi:transcription initiation factor TFIIIB Brf1 subunit/transcription initiation factor TFIIB